MKGEKTKKYLRIILSMLLVFAMALTIVACKPTPTPTPDGSGTPGAGETPGTDEPGTSTTAR